MLKPRGRPDVYGPPCGHIFVHPAGQGVQPVDEVDEEKESGTKTNGTRELESRGHMKASGRDGEESESVVHSRGKPSTCE